MDDNIMSIIDAERSRLKAEARIAMRERDAAVERMQTVQAKADDWEQLAKRDAAEFNQRQARWLAQIDRLEVPAQRLADFFISKTINLVTMRCTMCEREWVRDSQQEHDGDCPVGLVCAALDV